MGDGQLNQQHLSLPLVASAHIVGVLLLWKDEPANNEETLGLSTSRHLSNSMAGADGLVSTWLQGQGHLSDNQSQVL